MDHPEKALLCWKAKLARKEFAQIGCGVFPGADGTTIEPKQDKHTGLEGIHTRDQFGPGISVTFKEGIFCIPSVVTPLP
ncbi:MAG: hypothetical protein ACI8TX_002355 [Hyphomicrobiaceae bacterium]